MTWQEAKANERCDCPVPDAWRCARQSRLETVACHCPCHLYVHQPTRVEELEAIIRDLNEKLIHCKEEKESLRATAVARVGKLAEGLREALDVLPDTLSQRSQDWTWCWDQLSSDSQEHVKAVRRKATELVKSHG